MFFIENQYFNYVGYMCAIVEKINIFYSVLIAPATWTGKRIITKHTQSILQKYKTFYKFNTLKYASMKPNIKILNYEVKLVMFEEVK